MPWDQVVVLDNGSSTAKVGLASDAAPRVVAPNCTAHVKGQLKLLVADEVATIRNASQLEFTRPFERGHVCNWGCELEVWRRLLIDAEGPLGLGARDRALPPPGSSALVVSEPPFALPAAQATMDEVVFEELGFAAYHRRPAPCMSAVRYSQTHSRDATACCVLVVDAGSSSTHVMPVCCGRALRASTRRIDVGGALLTNHLKELLSYRQYNMMDEFMIVNDVKEKLCRIAHEPDRQGGSHLEAALAACNTGGASAPGPAGPCYAEFVLPDYKDVSEGFVKELEVFGGARQKTRPDDTKHQVLRLESERLTVPELLFHPIDIGLQQAGVAEAIVHAVNSCDPTLRGPMYAHVLLTGGSAAFPNFARRLESELRPLVPDCFPISIEVAKDPVNCAWHGGAALANDDEGLQSAAVTRAEFEERGSWACEERFGEWF